MSLFRQLWLAVIAGTLIAFFGSFIVSMVTARHYLEQQLAIKNNDNAASLALSMSQLSKDPVTIELQVAAVFDSGQYAKVALRDPEGKIIMEKTSPSESGEVPSWFIRLFPIDSQPGQAHISNGWTQFGTLELISHNRFAYKELWDGGARLTLWFSIGGLLVGFFGMQLLRQIKRPLDAVVAQAEAISERRFVAIDEPRTPELKSLAKAMNAMVNRLRAMFAEEAARLEQVRREATQDTLTGLANRVFFINQLQAALNEEDAPPTGSLIMLRLADLAGINKQRGRDSADEVLRRVGKSLHDLAGSIPLASAARLNGADFALLMPGKTDSTQEMTILLDCLGSLISAQLVDPLKVGHLACASYSHAEPLGNLMARLDAALASAETEGGLAARTAATVNTLPATSNADWKRLLDTAIKTQRLRLIEFPVADSEGRTLHLECPLRLQATENGEWLAAGSFMPMASRLSMTSELDLAAVRLALERIDSGVTAVAVNLSGESIIEEDFCRRLHQTIAEHRQHAPRLWLEIAEQGAFQHFEAFRHFCNILRPLGCRLGVEHFGRQFSLIGHLHDIGLDYLKVDGSFIRAIEREPGNQAFLKGLCSIAHNIGLTVIAESVQSAEELATLPGLGFDGATGPAIAR